MSSQVETLGAADQPYTQVQRRFVFPYDTDFLMAIVGRYDLTDISGQRVRSVDIPIHRSGFVSRDIIG